MKKLLMASLALFVAAPALAQPPADTGCCPKASQGTEKAPECCEKKMDCCDKDKAKTGDAAKADAHAGHDASGHKHH